MGRTRSLLDHIPGRKEDGKERSPMKPASTAGGPSAPGFSAIRRNSTPGTVRKEIDTAKAYSDVSCITSDCDGC
jgi:hypothetical protein